MCAPLRNCFSGWRGLSYPFLRAVPEGLPEAKLVIKNPLSTAPNDAVGRAYIEVAFGPPGSFESTVSGGDCNKPQQPCEARLVVELDIEREDGAQCVVGQPCLFLTSGMERAPGTLERLSPPTSRNGLAARPQGTESGGGALDQLPPFRLCRSRSRMIRAAHRTDQAIPVRGSI